MMKRALSSKGIAAKAAIVGAIFTILAGAAQAAMNPAPTVDPTRYVGRWYEVARLPNKLQTDCVAATSDWSREPGGVFDVVQTCRMGAAKGPAKIWRGAGKIIDAVTNSRFRIGFFGGFVKMDYQILARGDDYSWCILTAANPRFLWIMSRHPVLNSDQKAALIAHAQALGYNTSGLVFDTHAPTS